MQLDAKLNENSFLDNNQYEPIGNEIKFKDKIASCSVLCKSNLSLLRIWNIKQSILI